MENFSAYSPRSENNCLDPKDQAKRIASLLHENSLLKAELQKMRRKADRQRKHSEDACHAELTAAKKALESQSEHIDELATQLDRQTIALARVTDKYTSLEKMIKKLDGPPQVAATVHSLQLPQRQETQSPPSYHIRPYTGVGL